jgi:Asp-tRNA(Asn)/Glu-tRNA(Gln) amidotransferase C subunit
MRETLKELAGDLQMIHQFLEQSEAVERQLGQYWREHEAERDQLRAEVERLRGQSKAALLNAKQSQDGWSEALKLRDSATARAEVAERECVEYIDYRNQAVISRNAMERERDEARAHAEDLCGALSDELSWARAYGPCQAPHVKRFMCPHCVTERSKAALARTPAQSLGRIKAEALREEITAFVALFGPAAGDALEAEADRLEATDGR